MPKKLSIFSAVIVLWAVNLACAQAASVPTLDPNAASTAIAQTMNAIQTLSTSTQSPVPSPTLDSLTATPTLSATSVGSTQAAALPAVYVTVSVDTWCRLGPGAEYEKAGILLVGEIAEVLGRDAFGQFWYIRNPDIGVEFCWISAQYATVEGNVLSIIAQPPPADLSSDVDVAYTGMGKCPNTNTWWLDLQINNQSRVGFQSINLVVDDGVTFRSMSLNLFPFTDGCASPRSVDTLSPDSSVRISTPEFSYDLAGADISISMTICTTINMGGTCVSKRLAFIP